MMNEKVTRWLYSGMCSAGWAVDKLITGSLLVLWPVITLLTWASGCYLNPFKHQWLQWDECHPFGDLRDGDWEDVPCILFLSMLGNAVLAAAIAVLCIVACWMWNHLVWSIIIVGIIAVLVLLRHFYQVYQFENEGGKWGK